MSQPEDCRSETGITTGLIDSLISICRVLAKRDLAQSREALLDIGADEDVAFVLQAASSEVQRDT